MTDLTAFEAAVASPGFRYTRARSWRASGHIADNSDLIVYVYGTDPASPTGVTCTARARDFAAAVAILAKHGKGGPLAPTEALQRSR